MLSRRLSLKALIICLPPTEAPGACASLKGLLCRNCQLVFVNIAFKVGPSSPANDTRARGAQHDWGCDLKGFFLK